jgi:hypothetical protein
MKKQYIVYAVVFALSFFLFDRALFHSIRASEKTFYKKRDLASLFFRKREFNKHFVELPKGTYDIVIMGSSRTHRGVHPRHLYKHLGKKAFKIARGKAKPKFNYYFYKEYKKYAGIPELVIYGLDYFMFKMDTDPFLMQFVTEPAGMKYAGGVSLLLSNKKKIDDFLTNMLEKFPFASGAKPPVGRKVRKKNISSLNLIIDPFVGYKKTEPFDLERPPRFKNFKYVPFPGVEGEWFLKLLEKLEEDGVSVALVFLPSYLGTYESNFQRDIFIEDIRRLIAPFRNVHILNYNRPEKFRLDNADYFLDGGYGKTNSHLSAEGARVFNRMLARGLKKFWEKGN